MSQNWNNDIRQQLNNLPGFPAIPNTTPPTGDRWVLGDWLEECHVRPEVANFASLPVAGNQLGDVRASLADQLWYIWDGAAWQSMGGGGGGLPAPPANSVQFNNAGAFGGSANLTWNGTTLQVDGAVDRVTAGTLSIGTGTANAITIGSVGITTTFPGPVNLTGDVTTVGGTTFTTDATFEGNVTFGAGPADTVTFAALTTVTSDINFGGAPGTYKITNLANGTNPNDAVNKSQLDAVALAATLQSAYVNGNTITTSAPEGDVTIAGTEDLLFTSSGRAGFGTASPSSVLHADSNAVNTTPILTLENNAGDYQTFITTANPNSVITGSVGDLANDVTNGVMYLKTSGAATNTGWTALSTGTALTVGTTPIASGGGNRLLLEGATNVLQESANLTGVLGAPAYTITSPGDVNTGTDTVTYTGGDLPTYTRVRFTTTGSLPSGLTANTDYWTIRQSATSSKLAASYANAVQRSPATFITAASNGVALPTATINVNSAFTFAGSGTLSVATSAGIQTVTYTGKTGTSFTGCAGGTGTMATNGAVTQVSQFPVVVDLSSTGTGVQSMVVQDDTLGVIGDLSQAEGLFNLRGNGTSSISTTEGNVEVTAGIPGLTSGAVNLRATSGGTGILLDTTTASSASEIRLSAKQDSTITLTTFGSQGTIDINSGSGNGTGSILLRAAVSATLSQPILRIANTSFTTGDFSIFRTDATPQGVVVGSPGDIANDTTNGVLYLKSTGSLNVGWSALAQGTVPATAKEPLLTGDLVRYVDDAGTPKVEKADADNAANRQNPVGFASAGATTIAAPSNGQVLPQFSINVASTAGFPSAGTLFVVTSLGVQTVTYTGESGTQFTGCTGGAGTMSTGNAVTSASASVRIAGIADVPTARFDVAPTGADVGARVFMSKTAGQVTLTAPVAVGDLVQRVGVLVDGSANPKVLVQIGDPVLL